MEREIWKNLGLAGAVAVALGCGLLWYSSIDQSEAAPSVVTTPRPVRTVDAAPPKPAIAPKPTPIVNNQPGGRRDRPVGNETVVTGRPRPRPTNEPITAKKPRRPAA